MWPKERSAITMMDQNGISEQAMSNAQRVAVLSGGGTAGHINPALALAEKLQADGFKVYFAGTPKGLESRLVPEAGIPFKGFKASGFDRKHPLTLIKGVAKILWSRHQVRKWFKEIHPDVVVGFGGYVSIPVAMTAEGMGIPVVVHEQNSVMGMANKFVGKRAAVVCLTYDHSRRYLPSDTEVVVTGNPVRGSVMAATRREGRDFLDIPQDATVLLVFGGSLGARHINQAVTALKDELLSRPDLYIIHITGPKELASTEEALGLTDEEAQRYRVMGYQDHMAETLAAADLIVSRAGATSLAEISARGIPAILVPYPYATGDHQTTNARSWVESGAARMIPDREVESDAFAMMLLELLDDPSLRDRMHEAARSQGGEDAAARLAEVVNDVCDAHSTARP